MSFFFRYLQVQHFFENLLENIIYVGNKKGTMWLGCSALDKYDKGVPVCIPKDWNNDLNTNTDEETWLQIWKLANNM